MHHCVKFFAPCAVLAISLCCLVSIKQRLPFVGNGSTSLTRTTAFMRVPLLRKGDSDGLVAATTSASPLLQVGDVWSHMVQQHASRACPASICHANDGVLALLLSQGTTLCYCDPAQAWTEHCQQGFDCVRHPQPPSKAYLISLPLDAPKRDHTLRLLAELGLDVEVIDGIKSVQVR